MTISGYQPPSRPDELMDEAARTFRLTFGGEPAALACAPGRVNIIGEHTDYSGGFVLPAAVPLYTVVAAGLNQGQDLDIFSSVFGRARVPGEGPAKRGGFEDYLAGAVHHVGLKGTGLNIYVYSTLPVQAGLSSSASLLVASLACLLEMTGEQWTPFEVALAAQEVENKFVGVPCGFMDQFACACSMPGYATLLDCRDNSHLEVPTSFGDAAWVVINSGIRRQLTEGGYAHKVAGVHNAIERVNARLGPDSQFTRYLQQDDIDAMAPEAGLHEQEVRLLKHVCAENFRVHAMRYALERRDAKAAGTLLNLGHQSLSTLFRVSTTAIDRFVEGALALPGVHGMRLTGAGLGGSLVALVAASALETVLPELDSALPNPEGTVFRIPGFARGVEVWKP